MFFYLYGWMRERTRLNATCIVNRVMPSLACKGVSHLHEESCWDGRHF